MELNLNKVFLKFKVYIQMFTSWMTPDSTPSSCVQVIMATNRADTLDPALLRPGRLDRKIEFPLPDRRQKRLIFSTITSKMNLSEEVDLEDCILCPNDVTLRCCLDSFLSEPGSTLGKQSIGLDQLNLLELLGRESLF